LETKAASAYSLDLAIWFCIFGLIFWFRIGNFDESMDASIGQQSKLEKSIGIGSLELDFWP
jgi:hypothetical protein